MTQYIVALAQQAPSLSGALAGMLVPVLLIIGAVYLLVIRPRSQKAHGKLGLSAQKAALRKHRVILGISAAGVLGSWGLFSMLGISPHSQIPDTPLGTLAIGVGAISILVYLSWTVVVAQLLRTYFSRA